MKITLSRDLDGSLLDHDMQGFKSAVPAISELMRNQITLILASSKTGPKLSRLRERLQMAQWPAIVENGGRVLPECVLLDGVFQAGGKL